MKESVKFTNDKSGIAVCTLWTPLEIVERHLDSNDYAVIGQLYSRDAGINNVLRYCLYNKKIRYIVVCGQDRTKSGEALINLVEQGIDKNHSILGNGSAIDKEIPVKAVENFRKHVKVLDFRGTTDYGKIGKEIKKLEDLPSYGEPESFAEAKISVPTNFPTDPAFKVSSPTISEAWLSALNLIIKFGNLKDTQQEEKQKEIICLTAVISNENTKEPHWPNYMPFPKEELEDYYPQVLTDQKINELSYTYGQRMRGHKGIDQVKKIAEKIKRAPHSRRAVAITYDAELDTDSKNPPCLTVVQALVTSGKLYLIAYLRSSDIYGAWPRNAFALRRMQENLAHETKNKVGDLIMISASAHIYERHFRAVLEVLKDYPLDKNIKFDLPRSYGNLDPRGNIHIETTDGKLKITHLDPEGKRLEEKTFENAKDAVQWLVLEQKIGDLSHALYVGQELAKAQMCLKEGKKFVQDAPI